MFKRHYRWILATVVLLGSAQPVQAADASDLPYYAAYSSYSDASYSGASYSSGCRPPSSLETYSTGGIYHPWNAYLTSRPGYYGPYYGIASGSYWNSGGASDCSSPNFSADAAGVPQEAEDTKNGWTEDSVPASVPEPEPEPEPELTYSVNPGDTLYRISLAFNVSVDQIMSHNNILDPTALQVGQVLSIPAPSPEPTLSRSRILKVMSSTLTAYTAGYESTGKTKSHPEYGITYSGVRAEEGRTIAVDPKVIPLGSTVLIEGIGIRKAEDTGSAIRGARIDVYMEDLKEARTFGVKKDVKVYVLDNGVM